MMSEIGLALHDVDVDYPLFDAGAHALQRRVLNTISFGRIARSAETVRFVRALKGISFSLKPGNSVGLIGRNGAGKSTLLRLMAGTLEPTRGRVERHGRVHALLTIGSGMAPDLNGYQNIRRIGLLRGLSSAELAEITPEIVSFAQLEEFIDLPVRTYSSGMQMRLAFAIATVGTPDILLIDEVFGAGDSFFRQRAQARIRGLLRRSKCIVFSTHSANLIREFCAKCLYLEDGRIEAFGDTEDILVRYESDLKAVREAAE